MKRRSSYGVVACAAAAVTVSTFIAPAGASPAVPGALPESETAVFATPGRTTYSVPEDASSLLVEVWGPGGMGGLGGDGGTSFGQASGGGGGGGGGAGGGAGAYVRCQLTKVTPGQRFTVSVAAGTDRLLPGASSVRSLTAGVLVRAEGGAVGGDGEHGHQGEPRVSYARGGAGGDGAFVRPFVFSSHGGRATTCSGLLRVSATKLDSQEGGDGAAGGSGSGGGDASGFRQGDGGRGGDGGAGGTGHEGFGGGGGGNGGCGGDGRTAGGAGSPGAGSDGGATGSGCSTSRAPGANGRVVITAS